MDRHFLKGMNTQKQEGSVQASRQAQLLVEDGHHQVNGHSNPDLRLHRIGTRPVVMLDSQMAFDPAEEQFDLPAQPVEFCHTQRRDFEMVGQEDQIAFRFLVEVAYLSQERRKGFLCFAQSQIADLVAAQSRRVIHREGMLAREAQVAFGPRDKKGSGTGDQIQAHEIHVAAIHDVKSSRLEKQLVEPKHVVLACAGNVDAGRNRTAQIDLSVHLDSRFGAAEVGPREKCQRKIDGRGIERINSVLQFQAEILSGVKGAGLAHETPGQILPKPPIPLVVGIGQRRLGHRLPESEMIKGFGPGVQTGGDVPQSLSPSQLGKGHADKLLAATEMPNTGVRIVTFHQTIESLPMHKIENLGQDEAAGIHGLKSCPRSSISSNASHHFSSASRSKINSNNKSLIS